MITPIYKNGIFLWMSLTVELATVVCIPFSFEVIIRTCILSSFTLNLLYPLPLVGDFTLSPIQDIYYDLLLHQAVVSIGRKQSESFRNYCNFAFSSILYTMRRVARRAWHTINWSEFGELRYALRSPNIDCLVWYGYLSHISEDISYFINCCAETVLQCRFLKCNKAYTSD